MARGHAKVFSEAEIDEAIMAALAQFEEDWQEVETFFAGSMPDDQLKAIWAQMNPERKERIKQADPTAYRAVAGRMGEY